MNCIDVSGVRGRFATSQLWPVLHKLQQKHSDANVTGSICVIGVFHGKGACVLGTMARPDKGEHIVAVDSFYEEEDAKANNTNGFKHLFIRNFVTRMSTERCKMLRVLEVDSSCLEPGDLCGAPFRLFSIDGDRTCVGVLKSLQLAAATMVSGGVIMVADFWNPAHPGVHQAVRLFLKRRLEWAPFYVSPLVSGTNMTMLCRRSELRQFLHEFTNCPLNRIGDGDLDCPEQDISQAHLIFSNTPEQLGSIKNAS